MRWMEESDDSIRRAILSGDKDAYKVLMARYTQLVFRVAYRIPGNESDADEVVQEVFLRGYQSLASFQGRSSQPFVSVFQKRVHRPSGANAAGRDLP
jgi:hypothetical protein